MGGNSGTLGWGSVVSCDCFAGKGSCGQPGAALKAHRETVARMAHCQLLAQLGKENKSNLLRFEDVAYSGVAALRCDWRYWGEVRRGS